MTTLTYQIESTHEINGTRYTSVLEYCDSRERAIVRMRQMAAFHGLIENLSDDGLFFDNTGSYSREWMTFRGFPVPPGQNN